MWLRFSVGRLFWRSRSRGPLTGFSFGILLAVDRCEHYAGADADSWPYPNFLTDCEPTWCRVRMRIPWPRWSDYSIAIIAGLLSICLSTEDGGKTCAHPAL